MSEMVNNGFPAIVLLGLCIMPKMDSNCCPRFHLVLGILIRQCGKQVSYFKCRGDKKPNTRNRPGKKKKPGEKGQTKEPTGRLQENWQAISKVVESRMKKKADLMKS